MKLFSMMKALMGVIAASFNAGGARPIAVQKIRTARTYHRADFDPSRASTLKKLERAVRRDGLVLPRTPDHESLMSHGWYRRKMYGRGVFAA